jgi:hypothetical protein
VDVPPKKIPYFKMGKELKALLNGRAAEEEAQAQAQAQAEAAGGPQTQPSSEPSSES